MRGVQRTSGVHLVAPRARIRLAISFSFVSWEVEVRGAVAVRKRESWRCSCLTVITVLACSGSTKSECLMKRSNAIPLPNSSTRPLEVRDTRVTRAWASG